MALAKDTWAWSPGLITPNPANVRFSTLASAATIVPTTPYVHITGAVAIVNITPPDPSFSGFIILISDGIFTWTAAGNIAVAGTSTAINKCFLFLYDPSTAKWYPSVIA